MIEFEFNWTATIIGFIFSSILGFLWYDARTPMGELYMSEMGYDVDNLEVNSLHFGLDFLGRFVMIIGFGFVASWAGPSNGVDGILLGLVVWLFFLVSSHWAQVTFEQRKPKVYGIYVGYQFVVFLFLGLLFGIL